MHARGGLWLLAASLTSCSLWTDFSALEGGGTENPVEAGPSPPDANSRQDSAVAVDASQVADAMADASGPVDAGEPDPYRAAVLADQPVAYYSFDETSGSVTHDRFGLHHAALGGGATLGSSGFIGGAVTVEHDVYTASIDTGWEYARVDAQPYAFELWMKPALTGSPAILVAHQDDQNHGYALLLQGNGVVRWNQTGGGGGGRRAESLEQPLTDWVHVAVSFDGTTLALYVAGVAASNVSYIDGLIDGPMRPLVFMQKFQGSIDELAVYDHALPAQRVIAHLDAAPR